MRSAFGRCAFFIPICPAQGVQNGQRRGSDPRYQSVA
nr:MAG TPA: hypothetical protein [Caudoviricetes sp.]